MLKAAAVGRLGARVAIAFVTALLIHSLDARWPFWADMAGVLLATSAMGLAVRS